MIKKAKCHFIIRLKNKHLQLSRRMVLFVCVQKLSGFDTQPGCKKQPMVKNQYFSIMV